MALASDEAAVKINALIDKFKRQKSDSLMNSQPFSSPGAMKSLTPSYVLTAIESLLIHSLKTSTAE